MHSYREKTQTSEQDQSRTSDAHILPDTPDNYPSAQVHFPMEII